MISLHQASIPPVLRALTTLSHMRARGEAHCRDKAPEPAALLQARLHPDMFPLLRQVQIVSDTAIRLGVRLIGTVLPATPDTETTFAELQ